jgi:transcription elongation factor Elf1
MLYEQAVECPYCGETFTAFIDLSQGNHQTIEDCYVCCRPIEFLIESDGQTMHRFVARSDDDEIY